VQRHRDGSLVVSATDLVGYLACDHLTTLELGVADDLWSKPHEREDPEVRLLQERGEAHERAYLARLRAEGRDVVELAPPDPRTPDGYRAPEARTLAAMQAGAGAIYQALLFDGRWLGYADFLLRVERPSGLGPWSYEVADTKLARSVKGGAVLQVCVYSDRLAELQGVVPDHVHVVTGDGSTTTLPWPTTRPTSGPSATASSATCSATTTPPLAADRRPQRPTRTRSTTAASVPGSRRASIAAEPTTTSRSSRG
jgi:uncharacterized protein